MGLCIPIGHGPGPQEVAVILGRLSVTSCQLLFALALSCQSFCAWNGWLELHQTHLNPAVLQEARLEQALVRAHSLANSGVQKGAGSGNDSDEDSVGYSESETGSDDSEEPLRRGRVPLRPGESEDLSTIGMVVTRVFLNPHSL